MEAVEKGEKDRVDCQSQECGIQWFPAKTHIFPKKEKTLRFSPDPQNDRVRTHTQLPFPTREEGGEAKEKKIGDKNEICALACLKVLVASLKDLLRFG